MNSVVTCPVCGGNGLVMNGFYNQTSGVWTTGSTEPEMCRSCNGKGYVIVPEQVTYYNPTAKKGKK